MSGQSLLIIILVGIIAGWLAGLIVQGGMGLIGDLLVGIVGAFIGNFVLAQLHMHIGSGLVGSIISATIGAVILLFILRLVGGFGGRRI